MAGRRRINGNEARQARVRLGLGWAQVSLAQFRRGLQVELEHGSRNPQTFAAKDDVALTGRIALACLRGLLDNYRRLDCLEVEAANEAEASAYAYWGE